MKARMFNYRPFLPFLGYSGVLWAHLKVNCCHNISTVRSFTHSDPCYLTCVALLMANQLTIVTRADQHGTHVAWRFLTPRPLRFNDMIPALEAWISVACTVTTCSEVWSLRGLKYFTPRLFPAVWCPGSRQRRVIASADKRKLISSG